MPFVTYIHVTFLRSKTHATRQLDMELTAVQHITRTLNTIRYTHNNNTKHNTLNTKFNAIKEHISTMLGAKWQ